MLTDVPDYALMIGVPAKQVGWISQYGHKLEFNKDNIAECPESKMKYILNQDKVSLF